MINQQGIKANKKFQNETLNKFTINELIKMAENYSSNQIGQSQVVRKILERIDYENNQNEFTRTEIKDRSDYLNQLMEAKKYDFNANRNMRVMDTFDSQSNKRSYFHKLQN